MALLIVSAAPEMAPPGSFDLNDWRDVPLFAQKSDNWCWAASTQMIMEFLIKGRGIPQCTQVSNRYPALGYGCCNSNACDKEGWPEFEKYGFTCRKSDSDNGNRPLTWEQIQDQIFSKKRPIAFAYKHECGPLENGHMVVITGYKVENGVKKLILNDPLPMEHPAENGLQRIPGGRKKRPILFDSYQACYFWRDYYDIAPLPE